ncbi:uncharacterized protein [Physcomitrium patens]|uniref:uncharacterized protein isoform X1 n=1 Tax=Physcomitrium patens TaxID=3218 RepID=UPI000D16C178|nr:uncharacterized protein LOC112275633 isoform X1 [Physcomitrium patens]XP_024361939.1 uncharacterized protein LOC112275633 isoform X1 [Physcomitrium patens]|eukprot:XP_024361938.1 uncharacterized protein LOC112275633 isoform X1 [Physcomitrella patens]
MALLSYSSTVCQRASNRTSQDLTSRKSSHVMITFRSLSSGSLRGASKSCVHLNICRFSKGLSNASKLGFSLESRSRHRKFNGSREVRKLITGCARGDSNDNVGGDPQVQQMLVEMLQIQIGKSRVSDFVDERSRHMRTIARDTYDQYDRIAYRTMKGLDASGSRVLRQLDARAHAIDRELRLARAELEWSTVQAQELDFEEYQQVVAYSRNEGLFFKNLYPAPRLRRLRSASTTKSSVEKKVAVARPTRVLSGSYSQVLYGGLSLVIVSFMWSSSSALLTGTWMRASKLASYGMILSALLTQLACVKVLEGEPEVSEDKYSVDISNDADQP